ncbi:MAG TPA: hypothetical protein VFA21_04075 [Pyrinomonadaceae bacterium]|nr:hypothetical protein [Pyrinomonadaceae bacterium]
MQKLRVRLLTSLSLALSLLAPLPTTRGVAQQQPSPARAVYFDPGQPTHVGEEMNRYYIFPANDAPRSCSPPV